MNSNSTLVEYIKLSPHNYGKRNHIIDTVTIHCVVGQLSVETLGNIFQSERQASSNYGIGTDGKIAMYVEEQNASMCSSNKLNDQRAITIECSSDTVHPYTINANVMLSLIKLLTDICIRNKETIPKLLWKRNSNLIGKVKEQNITCHRWFAAKSCPGDYIFNRLGEIAEQVNKHIEDINSNTVKEEYEVRYNTLKELPEWAKTTIEKLVRKSIIADGNKFDLSEDMVRILVFHDRLGLYGE